jgi:uncharacterized repeat protein (TIGR02543 family)
MNRQRKILGIGAASIMAFTTIFLGGCANPANTTNSGPAKYSVTYDGNGNTGGTAPVDTAKYAQGTSVTVLANTDLIKEGKSFQGWAASNGAATPEYAPGSTFSMPAKNLTLYAVWANPKTWVVTFNANGGSAVVSQTVTDGQKATEPSQPTRAGHAFDGWYTGSDYAAKWDFSTQTVTAAITLYAKWKPDTYTLAYAAGANGTLTGATAQTVAYGGSGTEVTAVANSGYRFAQWSDGKTDATRAEANVTANLSLTATFAKDGVVEITFSGIADEMIDLSQANDRSLSKAKKETAIVSLSATYDTYAWFEDGRTYPSSSAKTFTINAKNDSVGVHNVMVLVTKNGVPYSKQLRYRIAY